MISFFTWIYNRVHQFREVFNINLEYADADCEFVILDLSSTDGFSEFIKPILITDERVRCYTEPFCDLHFVALYNRVARYCQGDILCCLDADNFIGKNFCDYARQWCNNKNFLWASDFNTRSGTYGRIAFQTDIFWKLGGYDESLGPVGYQDVDLIKRAKSYGLRCRHCEVIDVVGGAIPNSKSDTVENMNLTVDNYMKSNITARQISKRNIIKGKLIANKEL